VSALDELGSGIPMLGAPEVRSGFDLAYGSAAFVLLVLPELVSWVVEPPLFLLSDRVGKRRLVQVGLLGLGAAYVIGGLAPNAYVFALAMVLLFPASGLGVGLSQAALVEAYPRRSAALLARWTLLGSVGDTAAPLLLSVVVLVGGSWRTLMLAMGAAFLLQAVLTTGVRWRGPRVTSDEGDEPSFRALVRLCLDNRELWAWSAGVALTGLLDEVFVAFAALFLRDVLGASRLQIDLAITAYAVGALVGLAVTERLARVVPGRRHLLWASVGSLVVFSAWLAAPGPTLAVALLFMLGLFVAPQYPLAQAEAYRASPGRAGAAAAVAQLLAPVRLVFPLAVGLLADAVGLTWALTLLLAQPLGLALLAVLARDESGAGEDASPK